MNFHRKLEVNLLDNVEPDAQDSSDEESFSDASDELSVLQVDASQGDIDITT